MNEKIISVCTRCVMDSKNDPNLVLDGNGVCNHCHSFDKAIKELPNPSEKERELKKVLDIIKLKSAGQKYDCVLGLSGGVDSSYLAVLSKRLGLRPLIVHFDNGWNSELAVKNIESLITKLEFELNTYVVDWNEFRDLQRSYFKAGVVDLEIPTDHAIMATLYMLAEKYNIKYILSGHNVVTEGVKMPVSWRYSKLDSVNILDIQKRFGTMHLRSYPYLKLSKKMLYFRSRQFEFIKLLDYVDYNKAAAKKEMIDHYGWVDYGGKHYESIFTRFYQSYILPEKFKIDKRTFHYSCLVQSGQMTRTEALEQLKKPVIDVAQLTEDREYVLKKLGFTEEYFIEYMKAPSVSHEHYKTDLKYMQRYYNTLIFLSKIKKFVFFWRRPRA